MFIGWFVIADCNDGRTMPSFFILVGEEFGGECRLTGVMARGDDDDDVEEAVASEFLALAFPLLYIPDGMLRLRSS